MYTSVTDGRLSRGGGRRIESLVCPGQSEVSAQGFTSCVDWPMIWLSPRAAQSTTGSLAITAGAADKPNAERQAVGPARTKSIEPPTTCGQAKRRRGSRQDRATEAAAHRCRNACTSNTARVLSQKLPSLLAAQRPRSLRCPEGRWERARCHDTFANRCTADHVTHHRPFRAAPGSSGLHWRDQS